MKSYEELSKQFNFEFKIVERNMLHMDEYICDDRQDVLKAAEELNSMTDEEFEAYCEKLKAEEE